MDRSRDGVSPLTPGHTDAGLVDLHLHSIASDGALPPEAVVGRAAAAGLAAIALTDHDTLDGLPAALQAGGRAGIRVVPGCEFSVAASWGEMHLLGYFLPVGWPPLESFLARCRADRERRGAEMVEKLRGLGLALEFGDVLTEAKGGAVGRPHVARALVERELVPSVQDAFDRYLGWGRSCFVEKRLPTFREVADLVHQCGGVVSAAHLKERGTRATLAALKAEGLDAVETRHPIHDADLRSRLTDHALALGLLRTGGSDWHGDDPGLAPAARLGGQEVPAEWLTALEGARPAGREHEIPSVN
ncbi:MAG TPA: PHP domain-containing protein [Gemmatimonadales bacterium]|jgi:predicted metal-dependent phosphoesterase TrpH